MSRLSRIAADAALAVLATLSAIVLRTDLHVEWPDLAASLPYLVTTAFVSTLFVGASGLDLGFWRFASLFDIVRAIGVAAATIAMSVAIVFAYNRLQGVARSIPIMQAVLIPAFLLTPRLLARLRFMTRKRNPVPIAVPAWSQPAESVLVLGSNSLAEVFLRALLESGATHVHVAGVVAARRRHVGRFLRQYPVLGTFEEVGGIIDRLSVHGVHIRRVILAVPPQGLPRQVRADLAALETARGIRLDPIAMRLVGPADTTSVADPQTETSPSGRADPSGSGGAAASDTLPCADLEAVGRAPYWRWKRIVDVAGALLAMVLLLPLIAFALVLATIDLGWPPIFWQNRLGLGGAAFRLYKIRTMAPAHDGGGMLIPDEDRLSSIGRLLRRFRLDELPQLWNVLVGDMAITGPRPLLPVDQPAGAPSRLAVRPGITGWAQIQGGRGIGPIEKAALDLWWIRRATLALDLRIVVGTARMALLGDRVNDRAIAQALDGTRDA